jgi:hypothetical protein
MNLVTEKSVDNLRLPHFILNFDDFKKIIKKTLLLSQTKHCVYY